MTANTLQRDVGDDVVTEPFHCNRVRAAYKQRLRLIAARTNATVGAVLDDVLGVGLDHIEGTIASVGRGVARRVKS